MLLKGILILYYLFCNFRKTKYNENDVIKTNKFPAIFLNGTHITMIIPGYQEDEEDNEDE